jgi:Tol biopolymer transport system component
LGEAFTLASSNTIGEVRAVVQARCSRRLQILVVCAVVACAAPGIAVFGQGGLIAFQSAVTPWPREEWNLYVLRVATGQVVQLTQKPVGGYAGQPDFSHDGTRIVFTRTGGLAIYDRRTAETTLIEGVGRASHPSWSPDGARILYASGANDNADMYVRNMDTGQDTQLTAEDTDDDEPAWWPDGESIVFRSARDDAFWQPQPDGGMWRTPDIYRLDLATGQLANLTRSTDAELMPAVSPDGTRVVYAIQTVVGDMNLYVLNVATSKSRRLTNYLTAFTFFPCWSPDGQHIVFNSWDRRSPEDMPRLVIVGASDGTELVPPRFGLSDFHPSWHGSGLPVAPTGAALTSWGAIRTGIQVKP